MRRDQAVELLRAADPASEKTSEVDGFPSITALLDRIDERSTDVQTQERPRTEQQEPRDRRPRWLIPALAGAAAIILAIVVGTLVLAGGSDEPDVIEPTPTTTPTTVPEAVAPTPLEVMDLHSQAVAVGDWAALRALYADSAEFEVNSETGETFVERIALTDLVPQTPFDWDGDGVVDGFDALIDDAGRIAAHGATAFVSCSPVDDATLSCSEVWEGHAFMTPDTKHNSWTVTIVDGLITTQVLEVVQRQNPIDTDLTSQYNMWVTENRPELQTTLFDDSMTLAISPETVPIHRELVAEWAAQR
ncbi:MAG: hypothetical protein HKN74_13875 [Acidimicrobiia bacterium]|nr:hypothetical protein [Acidimicrobiia bacterium]NNF11363.1 hypothetical protein [Acidimicrobiia bacterium]NNL71626.1 hypothetical protein [Acidimicrobiia bacterium]